MTNPNAAVEVCECGHEESDHHTISQVGAYEPERECVGSNSCNCGEFIARDDHFYADLADEARLERWESER